MLIGASGAGKTTLAARLFEPSDVLSSDALREAVGGDASDQGATRLAFGILHRQVRRRLAAGRLVVVDATNVERAARLTLVRLSRAAGVPAVAIAIATAPADIRARNAARTERIVPAEVVDRHLARIADLGANGDAISATLLVEGFAAAYVIDATGELDALRARRVAGPGGERPV